MNNENKNTIPTTDVNDTDNAMETTDLSENSMENVSETMDDVTGNMDSADVDNNNNSDDQDAQTTSASGIDPEVAALRAKPLDEQLWFFIDDVIPTAKADTEVILCETGVVKNNMPEFTLVPKSMEIFEEISNMPNHAASSYPHMVKYFQDILHLYNDYVRQDVNPYWECVPLSVPAPALLAIFVSLKQGHQAFLSLQPRKGALPFRLIYGDSSHKHDFVGLVYLYVQ